MSLKVIRRDRSNAICAKDKKRVRFKDENDEVLYSIGRVYRYMRFGLWKFFISSQTKFEFPDNAAKFDAFHCINGQ